MLYNISFDICAGVLTLIAMAEMLFGRDMGRRSNRIFFTVVFMHLIAVIFDIWSSVCNSPPFTHGVVLRDFTNYIFLGVHTSEAAVFFMFLLEQLGITGKIKRWQRAAIWAPEVLMVLLPLLLNPFFRGVFLYDGSGFYIHGPAMPLIYAAADLYMAAAIVLVARYRSSLTAFQRLAAVMLLLVCVIPMLVQSIFMPHELIEMFFQALGFCGYLQSVENIDESRHPVTHAWNRHALARDFMKGLLNEEKIVAAVLKISQVESLRLSSESGAEFHHIRMSLAEWFQTNARQLGMKFYDCEKGIYVVLASGEYAEADCRKFAGRAEIRFQKPWGTDDQTVLFPAQISLVSFSDPEIAAQDFFYIIMQPYFGANEGVVYAETADLLRPFHAGEAAAGQSIGIPPELKRSLDEFLSRVSDLSPAERKIFDLYVAGYEVSEIPDKAFISINTVKKHNKNIYRKLGVGSREEIRLYVDLFFQCGRGEELTA